MRENLTHTLFELPRTFELSYGLLCARYLQESRTANKYQFVTSVHFNRGKVYIRHVLTHQEYDRGRWKL